jgi:hypothetical protein
MNRKHTTATPIAARSNIQRRPDSREGAWEIRDVAAGVERAAAIAEQVADQHDSGGRYGLLEVSDTVGERLDLPDVREEATAVQRRSAKCPERRVYVGHDSAQ